MLFDFPATLQQDAVLDWYELCSEGIAERRLFALSLLKTGQSPPDYLVDALNGATELEVNEYFEDCQAELDLSTAFTLIAAAEARIRLDAQKRIDLVGAAKAANNNLLTNRLGLLFSQANRPWSVSFYDDGILEAWKSYVATLAISQQDRDRLLGGIGGMKSALPLRHWVAHGRYWEPTRELISSAPPQVANTINRLYSCLRDIAVRGNALAFA